METAAYRLRAHRWHDRRTREDTSPLQAALFVVGLAALLLLPLLIPGRTFTAMYAHDVMGWVDAADRGLKGQIPNVDFRNALGPLSSLPLTAGIWIGGSFGAMFPVATALVTILLLPALGYAISTRLPLLHGAVFALFCLVILIAPLNPGDIMRWMSFAMFYNRWGWVALSILMILALPPKRPTPVLDAAVIAFLLLFMFYLKVTYAAVGRPKWGARHIRPK